jgi:hypothetical protein
VYKAHPVALLSNQGPQLGLGFPHAQQNSINQQQRPADYLQSSVIHILGFLACPSSNLTFLFQI